MANLPVGGGPACRVREVTRTAGFRRCSGHDLTCPLAAKDAARSIDWTSSGLTTEEVRLPAAPAKGAGLLLCG